MRPVLSLPTQNRHSEYPTQAGRQADRQTEQTGRKTEGQTEYKQTNRQTELEIAIDLLGMFPTCSRGKYTPPLSSLTNIQT